MNDRPRRPRPVLALLLHAVLLIAAAVSLVPFAWMIAASFKTGKDLFSSLFLPSELGRLTPANFVALFREHDFGTWLVNSLFLASTYTVVVVTLSSLGGFALAKYRFRGKRALMLMMLLTLVLPPQVLLPALYEQMHAIGWIDSYLAILIPGAVSVFGTFLFRQAMLSVPDDLLHAARVDGCSELRLWWEIALPLVRPMVGAFTLMSFLAMWNSFLWPAIVLQDERKYPLSLGLANLVGLPEHQTDYGVLMAGTLLSILPVAALFFALQRDFVAGLTSGALRE